MPVLPSVSIIIPCRNEEKFVRKVLEDIVNQDYPREKIEAIFMDGMSNDKTKSIIREYSDKYLWIKLFDNEKKIVPYAMNEGIKRATGDVIVRMDAHSSFPIDYVSKLIYWMQTLQADNVGAVWKTMPSDNSVKAFAIAAALSHPLGVGNALFRTGVDKPVIADTVPFGCYKRETLLKIGLYDERLIRNQDIELNKRLKKAGGKIFLVPDVQCIYYARNSYSKLANNNFKNGEWNILTSYYTGSMSSLSLRHFIPLGFVLYLLCLPLLLLISPWFAAPLALYMAATLFASFRVAMREKKITAMPFVLWSFYTLHLSYGFGSIAGLIKLFTLKKSSVENAAAGV